MWRRHEWMLHAHSHIHAYIQSDLLTARVWKNPLRQPTQQQVISISMLVGFLPFVFSSFDDIRHVRSRFCYLLFLVFVEFLSINRLLWSLSVPSWGVSPSGCQYLSFLLHFLQIFMKLSKFVTVFRLFSWSLLLPQMRLRLQNRFVDCCSDSFLGHDNSVASIMFFSFFLVICKVPSRVYVSSLLMVLFSMSSSLLNSFMHSGPTLVSSHENWVAILHFFLRFREFFTTMNWTQAEFLWFFF